jgi:hypothetical protein
VVLGAIAIFEIRGFGNVDDDLDAKTKRLVSGAGEDLTKLHKARAASQKCEVSPIDF